jgi:hypothetical protein
MLAQSGAGDGAKLRRLHPLLLAGMWPREPGEERNYLSSDADQGKRLMAIFR